MKKIVIVGAVAGGASCAARLRRLDENAQIVLVEKGNYVSFANCGLPYYIGDVIADREDLLLQTPESLNATREIDVRIQTEAIGIDRENKKIELLNLANNQKYSESYDYLVLSTGSSPLRPPIPGIASERIKTLWTVDDTDEIKNYIQNKNVKSALVVGGGFIGLEMAENLRELGLSVSLVEMLNQVMAPVDFEMAEILHKHLREKGVSLYLSDGVKEFNEEGKGVRTTLSSGKHIDSELVILSIGVRPNGQLGKDAGLLMNQRGGIVVDQHMCSSDPSIYAVGDVVEIKDFVSQAPTMIPLAGPANKQGRIAADNIAGKKSVYQGTQGTSIAKVFDLSVGLSGHNEKMLEKAGKLRGVDYEVALVIQNSHASYYPGATPNIMKLIFDISSHKILGIQAVGQNSVDKLVDTVATVMRLSGTVYDLCDLELSYAPPFGSAKANANMLGYVAANILEELVKFAPYDVDKKEKIIFLDVREADEITDRSIPGFKHIPVSEIRANMDKLDKKANIVISCASGVRAYNVYRILSQNGFENIRVYPGGYQFYSLTHS